MQTCDTVAQPGCRNTPEQQFRQKTWETSITDAEQAGKTEKSRGMNMKAAWGDPGPEIR